VNIFGVLGRFSCGFLVFVVVYSVRFKGFTGLNPNPSKFIMTFMFQQGNGSKALWEKIEELCSHQPYL
jgi:hypothetical protein